MNPVIREWMLRCNAVKITGTKDGTAMADVIRHGEVIISGIPARIARMTYGYPLIPEES